MSKRNVIKNVQVGASVANCFNQSLGTNFRVPRSNRRFPAVAGNCRDPTVGADLPHAVVPSIGDKEIACAVQGKALRPAKRVSVETAACPLEES